MIDLHAHTFFSDGELSPAELVQRADAMGHRAIALTDHVDMSNLELVVPRIAAACRALNDHHKVIALAGVELTHVPSALIGPLAQQARQLGALVVVVHGETLVEPVPAGTNLAAIEAGVDVLAHPGLIGLDEARLAARRDVALEISTRGGHSLANGHVAAMARQAGAKLVINTDSHAPRDLVDRDFAGRVGLAAGLSSDEVAAAYAASEAILTRATGVLV